MYNTFRFWLPVYLMKTDVFQLSDGFILCKTICVETWRYEGIACIQLSARRLAISSSGIGNIKQWDWQYHAVGLAISSSAISNIKQCDWQYQAVWLVISSSAIDDIKQCDWQYQAIRLIFSKSKDFSNRLILSKSRDFSIRLIFSGCKYLYIFQYFIFCIKYASIW